MKGEKQKKNREIISVLLNNFNTIKVFFFLEETIALLNKSIDTRSENRNFHELTNDFYFILEILGFEFDLAPYNFNTKLLIRKWEKLRRDNNYVQADEIRSKLQKSDII